MQEQPQIRWDEATQSVVELAPVAVSRDKYQADLEAAQVELNEAEAEERTLTDKRVQVVATLKEIDQSLETVGTNIEGAKSRVGVQEARIKAYDEVVQLHGQVPVAGQSNEAAPATADAEPVGAIAGQPSAEDVASDLDLADESEAPAAEEVIVPVRRRATV